MKFCRDCRYHRQTFGFHSCKNPEAWVSNLVTGEISSFGDMCNKIRSWTHGMPPLIRNDRNDSDCGPLGDLWEEL